MENGKLENQLALALELPEEERARTENLNVGYLPGENAWELVLRYHGAAGNARQVLGVENAVTLLNGYVIATVPQSRIEALSALPEVEYIEKPKKLLLEAENGLAASCFFPLQREDRFFEGALTGEGVIVAIVDSGIDYRHPDFRNPDGSTRLIGLWDMTLPESRSGLRPPEGYLVGSFYSEEDINQLLGVNPAEREAGEDSKMAEQPALDGESRQEQEQPIRPPSADLSGHGTAVAGIACGNGRASAGRYRGAAYESRILAVKLGATVVTSLAAQPFDGRTTQLMEAVDFCIRMALQRVQPMVINISFGTNYGAHNGSSLLERYLAEAAGVWKTAIVIGSGNEGGLGHHASGRFVQGERSARTVEWVVAAGERSINLQLWSSYLDEMTVTLRAPSGQEFGPVQLQGSSGQASQQETLQGSSGQASPQETSQESSGQNTGTRSRMTGAVYTRLDSTEIYLYIGEPTPYDALQEIYMEFLPVGDEITSGIWSLTITPVRILSGRFDLWLPAAPTVGSAVRFLRPDPNTTLTIPSTVQKGITVGAYDTATSSVAFFSGRGFLPEGCTVKPELIAPGVNIYTTAVGGGYSRQTGTSFAAPFVTGACALLMQWGIVWGNDRYLYGDDCVIIGLNQRKAHKQREFRWFSPNLF